VHKKKEELGVYICNETVLLSKEKYVIRKERNVVLQVVDTLFSQFEGKVFLGGVTRKTHYFSVPRKAAAKKRPEPMMG